MSEYGLMVLAATGVALGFIAAAALVRGVVWALFAILWPGGSSVVPNSASKRPKLR